MWPLDRPRPLLRVGRAGVELWLPVSGGWRSEGSQTLPAVAAPEPADLATCIVALLSQQSMRSTRIDLVVESMWLPVLLLELGPDLLTEQQVQELLRHHVDLAFAERHEPASKWSLQVDYRPGEHQALGAALSPAVRAALAQAEASSGCRWASLQPALLWSLQRGRSERSGTASWYVCLEQDRRLLALRSAGRVIHLNAGASPSPAASWDPGELGGLISIESARAGVTTQDLPVVVLGWQRPEAASAAIGGAVKWLSVVDGTDHLVGRAA